MNVQFAPYWFALRHVQPDEVRRLAPGMDLIDASSLGDSRVAMKAPTDVAKLRTAIIAAYEREAARRAEDGDPRSGDDG